MEPTPPTAGAIAPGRPVYARDGARLGVVKALRDGYYQVNTRRASDYWLPPESVVAVDEAGVRVVFAEEELRWWRNVTSPGPAEPDGRRSQ